MRPVAGCGRRNGFCRPSLERVYDLCKHSPPSFAAKIQRVRNKQYDSDISREQFVEIESDLRAVRHRTKPTQVDLHEVFCAILYLLRTGCQWRYLPPDFPRWQTVYSYWSKWSQPDEWGISTLERVLKKICWRGPRETGAQRIANAIDRRRAERQEQ